MMGRKRKAGIAGLSLLTFATIMMLVNQLGWNVGYVCEYLLGYTVPQWYYGVLSLIMIVVIVIVAVKGGGQNG